MIPELILAALNVTALDLAEFSVVGKQLMDLYEIAGGLTGGRGVNLRFYSQFMANIVGSTRSQAAVAYRIAKFYSSPGGALSLLGDAMAIPRGLMRSEQQSSLQGILDQNYRYGVRFLVTFPGTTEPRMFNIWYYSDRPLSMREIYAGAWSDLVSRWSVKSTPTLQGGEMEEPDVQSSVTDMIAFTME